MARALQRAAIFSNESPTQWVSFERVKLCLTRKNARTVCGRFRLGRFRKKTQAALTLSGTILCAITHRSIVAAMSGSVLPTGMSTFMSTR